MQDLVIDAIAFVDFFHFLPILKQRTLQNHQCYLKYSTLDTIFIQKIFHFLWRVKEFVRVMDPILMIQQQRVHDFYSSVRHDDYSIQIYRNVILELWLEEIELMEIMLNLLLVALDKSFEVLLHLLHGQKRWNASEHYIAQVFISEIMFFICLLDWVVWQFAWSDF